MKGKLYSAAEAKELGLVDEVVTREQLIEAARAKIAVGKRKPSAAPEGEADGAAAGEGQPRAASKTAGNAAPARAQEIISKTLRTSIDDSLRMELDAIVELGETESTRNLIRNFFLADKYRKGSSKTSAEKIVHAAVIGAGVMGSGIAQWLSSRGVSVILRDVNSEAIDRGLTNIEKTYADAVKRGLMSEEKAKHGRACIVASTAPVEMRAVQIVIEAASEKLEIKKQIFADLANKTGPNAILATNTSALPIAELAASTGSPERVIGLHFFNPVSRMKLVEVVVGKQTAPAKRERALAFTRQIGKLPVVVQDSPGFLVNRVLFPYLIDAAQLFRSGREGERNRSTPLSQWGMPMGPLRLIDEIGVDITVDIANTLEKAYGERDRASKILLQMREEKLLGRKSGSGFYKYEGKTQSPNEQLDGWRDSGNPPRFSGRRSRLASDLPDGE